MLQGKRPKSKQKHKRPEYKLTAYYPIVAFHAVGGALIRSHILQRKRLGSDQTNRFGLRKPTWHRGTYWMGKPRSWMRGSNSKESLRYCKKHACKSQTFGIRFPLLRVHTCGSRRGCNEKSWGACVPEIFTVKVNFAEKLAAHVWFLYWVI